MTMTAPEKALTVRPPYSWLIESGAKPADGRTRRTHYRGPIAIHAGLRFESAVLVSRPFMILAEAVERKHLGAMMALCTGLPTVYRPGHIVAVAQLSGCHEADGDCCGPFVPAAFPWHWELNDVEQLIDAIPATGALGLWGVPPVAREQLAHAKRRPAPWHVVREVA